MSNVTLEDDPHTLLSLDFIVNVVLDGLLCVLGYVGNTLAIVALSKDKFRNSNVFLLQILAVYDIIFLTHTVLYTVLRSVYPTTGYLKDYHDISPYIIAFDLPFGWIAQTGTIWLTMVLAADRYLGISRPFKALTICTLQNAKKASIIISVTAFLFNFPRFFYYFQVAVHSDNNSTFIAHVRMELPGFDSHIYRYVYHIFLTLIFLYIIPLTVLSVLNYKLIKTLQVASNARKRMSTSQGSLMAKSQNIIITFNLVIVISKFIICETPDFISSIVGAIPATANRAEYKMFNTIKEMLLVFNSAANFYIYCMFNGKFRENLFKVFPCCLKVRKEKRKYVSTTTLNTSLSCISLAVTAIKSQKMRVDNKTQSNTAERKTQSTSNVDVREETEPPEDNGDEISMGGRLRLCSDESQITVSTNLDSESEFISDIQDTHKCGSHEDLTFKPGNSTGITSTHTLTSNVNGNINISAVHFDESPQGPCETEKMGIPQCVKSLRPILQTSVNESYLIFNSCRPRDPEHLDVRTTVKEDSTDIPSDSTENELGGEGIDTRNTKSNVSMNNGNTEYVLISANVVTFGDIDASNTHNF